MKHCLYKKDYIFKKALGSIATGLDLGDGAIRYATFGRTKDKTLVARSIGMIAVSEDVFAHGEIRDGKKLESLLKTARRKQSNPYVRASIPEEHTHVLDMTLPKGDKRKIIAGIKTKLAGVLPVAIDEMLINYEILSEDKESFHLNVSLAKRSFVDMYLAMLTRAGFKVVSLELRSDAIAHALVAPKDRAPHLVVNFEGKRLALFVVHEGFIMAGTVAYIVDARDFHTIKTKIDREYIAWHELVPNMQIASIILTGSGAVSEGLLEYILTELRMPVALGNVWGNAHTFEEHIPEIICNDSHAYHAAIGLALEEYRK